VNVILAIFNLLPAFPMDGGRVLRAALAMRTSFENATEIAARLGKGFALLFALFGLFVVNNPFLVIIGVFVWLSAAAESSAAQLKMTVGNVAVSKAMITDVRTLAPTESVSAAIEEVRHGFQHDFPVVDHDNIAGVLTREGLLRAMAEGHADETVGEVMQKNFCATTPDESLEQAMQRLQEGHCQAMPVLQGRQVVGLLTAEKIQEFVLISTAARAGGGRAAA
jgi:CBS domain-containing protein